MSVSTEQQPGVLELGIPCGECREAWLWVAMYRDGEYLAECRGAASLRGHAAFADIDLERVVSMALVPTRPGLNQVVVQLSRGMQPVFFRRHYLELQIEDGRQVGKQTIHCLGWRRELASGETVWSFTFVFADGSILLSDDRNAV